MSGNPALQTEELLPLDLARQVDQAADRFEDAWVAGQRLRIEDFLAEVPEPARPALLRELLRVEWEQRRQAGEHPQPEEYRSRFPDSRPLVDTALSRWRFDKSAIETLLKSTVCNPRSVIPEMPGYEILGILGQGGMGIVYRARDTIRDRLVALKMILTGAYASEQERGRFRTEAEAVARLAHPNVVQIYEVGEHDGHPFLALEFIEGVTLAAQVAGTPQQPREAAELVETLARTAHAAHEAGIIHRDLKPANILLASGGLVGRLPTRPPLAEYVPKITDFGLAKQLDSNAGETGSGAILGTPSYMAPEQAEGKTRDAGPQTDVYALGAILYEMLTGRPPFKGATVLDTLEQVRRQDPIPPRRQQPKVPRDLDTICLKCLRKEPRRRYADARALAEDLRAFLDGRTIRARPIGFLGQTARWARRHPGVAAMAILLLLTNALGTSMVIWKWASAVSAQHEAETHRQRAERFVVAFSLDSGLRLCEQGDVGRGMLLLARTIEMHEAKHLDHALRANLGAWRQRLHALHDLLPHSAGVEAVSFSPDGSIILTVSEDHKVRLWTAHTGEPLGPPLSHPDELMATAFAPDGTLIVTGCADGMARLWETKPGRLRGSCVKTLSHGGSVRTVAFGPGGQTVVTGSNDKLVRLWSVATGACVATGEHKNWVRSVAVSPDGKTILTGGADGAIRLWDAATLKPVRWSYVPTVGSVRVVGFIPTKEKDEPILLTVGRGKERSETAVALWQASTGRKLTTLPHHYWVRAVAISHDGTRILTGSEDHTAQLWETNTGKPLGRPLAHQDTVRAVAFSPDGKTLLTGSDDRTARLWDAGTGRAIGQPLEHQGPVRAVAFSPDGKTLLTAGRDGIARLWEPCGAVGWRGGEVVRGAPATSPPHHLTPSPPHYPKEFWHEAQVMAVALSPDGRTLVTGLDNGKVSRWEAATGKREPLGDHKDDVWVVAFSPDGQTILTGSRDRTLSLWDATTGKRLRECKHNHRVRCAAFRPDGQAILAGGGDASRGELRLWEASTGAAIEMPFETRDVVWAVAFSPDGKTCAIASGDRSAQLWDVASGQRIGRSLTHESRIVTLAFSPDGRSVLTGSTDKTARLWSASTGAPRRVPGATATGLTLTHQGAVWGVAFGREGKLLVTGSRDGTARLWDAVTGTPVGPSWPHQEVVWAVVCHPSDGTVLTGSADMAARLWQFPEAVQGDARRVALWVEVMTDLELDDSGTAQWLDVDAWRERRRQLQEFGGPLF